VRPEPFRIEPIFSERLWGARSLAPFFPEMHDLKSPVGEAWLTALDCQIAGGPFKGKTLGQAWKDMTIPWRGMNFAGGEDFPLLLKFIFPTDKLSIQVHPDDAYAAIHEIAAGGRGKTEMWYVVSADPGARLLAGLKPGATKEKFLVALADHSVEDLFQSHEVHAGDTFFIPAGLPHTIGPDMVICEVQQYSDLTYRLYDYDRRDANGKPRELHIDKALEVMNYNSSIGGKVEPRPLQTFRKQLWLDLVECPYFSTSRFEFDQPSEHHSRIRPGPPQEFSLWVFLEGEGQVDWVCNRYDKSRSSLGKFFYKPGECWFLPAVFMGRDYYPKTKTSVLVASPRNPKLNSTKYWQAAPPREKSWIKRILGR
jgi:mannose-6-phosphate isomerase